jgi:hypothetical protein
MLLLARLVGPADAGNVVPVADEWAEARGNHGSLAQSCQWGPASVTDRQTKAC